MTMANGSDAELQRQLMAEMRALRRAVLTLAAAQLRASHLADDDSKAKDRVKALWKQIGYEHELTS
jgi:hypothetical protein